MKGRTEGLITLNQTLLRWVSSCWKVFRGMAHFRASLPLLSFLKNMSFMNPSLYLSWSGGGFTPWMTRQGAVEASNRGNLDASLLAQYLDVWIASADSFQIAAWFRLDVILSADEAIRNLVTFAFMVSLL